MDDLLLHSARLLTDDEAGGHGDHWGAVTENVKESVLMALPEALQKAQLVQLGMYADRDETPLHVAGEPEAALLLYAPSTTERPSRNGLLCVIELNARDSAGKPCNLVASFYPLLGDGCQVIATISEIGLFPNRLEARLELSLQGSGAMLWAFDPLFAQYRGAYRRNEALVFSVAGLAYAMEPAPKHEHVIDDPQDIRRFRARNAWAKHHGYWSKDEDEEASLAAWKPTSPEDFEPVRFDMSHMTMLMPASDGPSDDVGYMGEVMAVTPNALRILDGVFCRVDVLVMQPDEERVVLPIYVAERLFKDDWRPQVGEFVTGSAWVQAYPLRRVAEPPVSAVPAAQP
jgi:hypothetical protein